MSAYLLSVSLSNFNVNIFFNCERDFSIISEICSSEKKNVIMGYLSVMYVYTSANFIAPVFDPHVSSAFATAYKAAFSINPFL